MPDNVRAPLGTQDGATFASDDVGGIQYARTKISVGADGQASDVHDGNPLPVRDRGLAATSVVAGVFNVPNGVAGALPSATARRFRVKAADDNDQQSYVWLNTPGAAQGAGYPLRPGDVYPHALELSDLNVLGASATVANQKLYYFGEV
jgi:hypothetical protein